MRGKLGSTPGRAVKYPSRATDWAWACTQCWKMQICLEKDAWRQDQLLNQSWDEWGWNNRVQGLFPKPHSVRKKVLWEDYPGVGTLTRRSTYALKYPFPAKNVQPMLNNFMPLSSWLSPGVVLPQHRLPVGCHLRWHGWELFEALFTTDLMLQMLPHECFHCGHNNLFKIKHIMIT